MSDATEVRVEQAALGTLHDRVGAAPTALVWLLDAGAAPADGALDALLEHAPAPAASLPVDAHGQVVAALMGRVEEADPDAILDAVQRRSVPLRHIQLTSLLVERDLVLDLPPPEPNRFGGYAGAEWTARLFARRRGLLVPGSRVTVGEAAAGSPAHLLRAARSAGWRSGETVRELQRAVKSTLR